MILSGLVSFIDDIKSLPNWLRFLAHLVSGLLILYQLDLFFLSPWWIVFITIMIIGVINAYNFMDGINGITGLYSLAVILPLVFTEKNPLMRELQIFALISVLVFLFFNARKRARCFAGDVGSVGIAILIIFLLLERVFTTQNINYAGFLLLYGVDSVLTIIQRLYARKHLFQLFSNEFRVAHLAVSTIYGVLQIGINALILSLPGSPYILLIMVASAGALYIAVKLSAYKYLDQRYPGGR
jgi:UDP-N-acetylmuramyl pentapeptide phosphotransferase/UDP-N-acetylglucosamine-1-phosphate transferase